MDVMKDGWQAVKLGEVCGLQNGFAFKSTMFKSHGTPVLRISNIQNDEICNNRLVYTDPDDYKEDLSKYEVRNGDLLIAMSGATTGKVGFNSTSKIYLLNQRVGKFEPKKTIDKKYLYYFLSTRVEENLKMSAGSAQPNLSTKQIKDFIIPMPPLPEQKRIVAILDGAFAVIERAVANTEKNLANARELFDGFQNSVLSQPNENWKKTSLGKEIDLLTGFAFKSKEYTEAKDGIPLLRGDNITQGELRWKSFKRWPKNDTSNYKKYELEEGDIVLAMDRTWVKAGLKYAQISSTDLPCLLVQRVARLRSKKEMDGGFLKFLIGSPIFTEYVLAIQTGLSVPHISGKQISDFEFLRPSVKEQTSISSTLIEMQINLHNLESIYISKIAALSELKQSLLQKAFSGELTADPERALKEAAA